ncbi:hypothetical protein QAD02_014006 [Eretmocerus hayati]|uniref:Uncharacterized protein n=1 Tax=Eretmocerus hayati TaxID=131215 RepID=A0ACC2P3P7_9HYME|nr:hypothetical protein QAD02_014006 [Eretmocerus hayati]
MLSKVNAETYEVIAKVYKPEKPGEGEHDALVKAMCTGTRARLRPTQPRGQTRRTKRMAVKHDWWRTISEHQRPRHGPASIGVARIGVIKVSAGSNINLRNGLPVERAGVVVDLITLGVNVGGAIQ